jgi:hypothetical protein
LQEEVQAKQGSVDKLKANLQRERQKAKELAEERDI